MMYLFIVLVTVAIVAGIFKFIGSVENKNSDFPSDEKIDYEDFEVKFFDQVKSGKKYQHFLNVASQTDCAMIRSLLALAGIYSYIENEKMNTVYGGLANTINNLFCIKLYILNENYDEALEIVSDYIKKKIERLSQESDSSKFEKALKTLLSIMVAPYSISKDQEILGISIMSKEE